MNKNVLISILVGIIVILLVVCLYFIYNKDNEKNEVKEDQVVETTQPIKEETKEEKVENYFNEEISKDENLLKEDTKENQSKLKKSFITLTDFIFYNGEIKGTTFKELKTDTQNKLLEKWNYLDSKIENKYPNYKEKTFKFTEDKYTKVKEKAKELKDLIKGIYDEKVKTEEIEEKKEVVKEKTKEVTEKAKEKKDELKSKLKSWYEEYREEE